MSTDPPPVENPKPVPNRRRWIARVCFRCIRTTLIVILLIGAILGLFLNKVGLPEILKTRVITQARAKGWEVEFSRLRLRWYRGLVAENLHIQGTNGASGPQLFVEEAESPLNLAALRGFELKPNALRLAGGRFVWPLAVSNETPSILVLNNLNGQVRFHDDGRWDLGSLSGELNGVKLELSGSLTNALMLPRSRGSILAQQTPGSVEAGLRQVVTFLRGFKFAGSPELRINFDGDGRQITSANGTFYFSVPAMDSRWGTGANVIAAGQLIPNASDSGGLGLALKLTAEHANTRWGSARAFRLNLELKPGSQIGDIRMDLSGASTRWGEVEHLSLQGATVPRAGDPGMAQTAFTVAAQQVRNDWGLAGDAQLTATASHSVSNWFPAIVSSDLRLQAVQTRWGDARGGEVRLRTTLPATNLWPFWQTNLAWPERLAAFPMEVNAALTNVHATNIDMENLSLALDSRPSQLRLESSGRIGAGEFKLDTRLQLPTRQCFFSLASAVDPARILSLFPTNAQTFLRNYSFQSPPKLEVQGSVLLPPWTNQQPDWASNVPPAVGLAGRITMGPGDYRGAAFTSLESPFSLTNLVWRMPGLKLTRPEGALVADYEGYQASHDFHVRVHSEIDPRAVKPLFPEEAVQQSLDFFEFTKPPVIDAELWGRWGDLDRLGAVARVAGTNFVFRNELVKDGQTRLTYTNYVLSFFDSRLQRDRGERGTAVGIMLDLREQKLFFTNTVSTLNPYAVARSISKQAIAAIGSYQFDAPPTVRVHGAIDLRRKRYEDDAHFEISGAQFHWQEFHLEQLLGNIDWVGQTLTLTNVVGGFKTGRLAGDARFDFSGPGDGEFSFKSTFDKADLREIAAPFSGRTNKLEGLLSGEFVLSHAALGDWKSWEGRGRLNLHDGLIWDIPMFGILSPVLNGFLPGLGNSRANEAEATFVVTNGVFFSKDMELHATMMRMRFKGAVGLNSRVDARIEAELLRDLPAVGFIVSKVFWPVTKLFEYKVTGNLSDPKGEPLYIIPKILLMPFHPLKTLKGIFIEEPRETTEPEPKKPAR